MHLLPFSRGLIALCLLTFSAQALDWAQYRGPHFNGHAPGRVEPWNSSGPRILWKRPLRDGFSSFVIQNKTLATLVLREKDGVRVEACISLDPDTGRQRWVTLLTVAKYTGESLPDDKDGSGDWGAPDNLGGDGPRSTPSIDGNRIFVLSSALTLYSLEADTGEIVWQRDLLREHSGQEIYYENAASPLVVGNLVLVAGGGPGQSILAFDKGTGEVVWKGLDEQLTQSTPVFAEIHNKPQAIFYTRSGLVSLRPKDGSVLWRYNFPYRVCAAISPVVGGNLVYCSAGYGIGSGVCEVKTAVQTQSATEVWRLRRNEPVANYWSTPIHMDGYLYGMFSFKKFNTGPMKCVDMKTGTVKWTQPGFGHGNVIAVGETLVALAGYGDLVLIHPSPDAYRELARAKVLSGKCWSTPIYSDGRLYLRSTKEAVCIQVSDESTALPPINAAEASPNP